MRAISTNKGTRLATASAMGRGLLLLSLFATFGQGMEASAAGSFADPA